MNIDWLRATSFSRPSVKALKYATVAAALAASCLAQPERAPLTNNDVIQMVKAKLPDSLIQSQIRESKLLFDLSTAEIIRLTKEGVSEAVIAAMRSPAQSGRDSRQQLKQAGIKTPEGEKIRLILSEDISSSTANVGDRVSFTVAEDVKVGEVVVIAKGASASGAITEAKKKGMLGQPGKLLMTMNQVKAVDSQNIRLRATSGREGEEKLGKTVVVAVLAGPFALLVKGKDTASPKGTEYTAYIDEAKDVVAN